MRMMFSWSKWRRSLISRRVRRQNIEWSNGVMRFMATLRCEGRWIAELVGGDDDDDGHDHYHDHDHDYDHDYETSDSLI